MSRFKIFLLMILGGVILTSCGEDLKDTYAKYAGGGEIRYLGKCTEVTATAGWKRIILKWENNVDPLIKHTKIVWANSDFADSAIVDRGVSELNITSLSGAELEDATYEITLTAIDDNGNASIPQTTYCRPFTPTHEQVVGFTQLLSKIYTIKHRLVLATTGWADEIINAQLTYTLLNGTEKTIEITPEIANQYYYLVPDEIDESKPIKLTRRGTLPECGDEIAFDPIELDTERTFDSNFKQEMKVQYGLDELTEDWADKMTTLYIDRDINSLIDILNLPNLKKLVLGGHRYQLDSGITDTTYGQSAISDVDATNFAIKLMGELCGTKVEVYNQHYQGITGSNVKRMGKPTEPNKNFIDLSKATITNSQEHELFTSYVENLIDGDVSTYWDPVPSSDYLTYDLVINLGASKNISGLKFVQNTFKNSGELAVAPSIIKVYVSKDNTRWYNATYTEESTVGQSNGETTYIDFTPDVAAAKYQYVKVTVGAGSYRGYYYSKIAELGLY